MAGIGTADLALIDLYSCFPSAVEIGAIRGAQGSSLEDPRGFTVTGGLPYAGGPGNNYSMHAVATMVGMLRERPGAYGLSTANGWFLTKQSVGVYSTQPFEGEWVNNGGARIRRCDPAGRSTPCRTSRSSMRPMGRRPSRPTPSCTPARATGWASSSAATPQVAASSKPTLPPTRRRWRNLEGG